MGTIRGGIIGGNGGMPSIGRLHNKAAGDPYVVVSIGDSELVGSSGGSASSTIAVNSRIYDWQSATYKNGGASGEYLANFGLVVDDPQRTTPTLGGGVNQVGAIGNNRGSIARGTARVIADYYKANVHMLSIAQPAISFSHFVESSAGDIEMANQLPVFLAASGQDKVDVLNVCLGVNSAALNSYYPGVLDSFNEVLERAESLGYYTPGYTKVLLFGHTNDVGGKYWSGNNYIYDRTGPDVGFVPEADLPTIEAGNVHHSADLLEFIGERGGRTYLSDPMSKTNGLVGPQTSDWYAAGTGEITLYTEFGRAGSAFSGEVLVYGRTDDSDETYIGKYVFAVGSGPAVANPYLNMTLLDESGDLTEPLALSWVSGIPGFGPVFKVTGSVGNNWTWYATTKLIVIPDQE